MSLALFPDDELFDFAMQPHRTDVEREIANQEIERRLELHEVPLLEEMRQ